MKKSIVIFILAIIFVVAVVITMTKDNTPKYDKDKVQISFGNSDDNTNNSNSDNSFEDGTDFDNSELDTEFGTDTEFETDTEINTEFETDSEIESDTSIEDNISDSVPDSIYIFDEVAVLYTVRAYVCNLGGEDFDLYASDDLKMSIGTIDKEPYKTLNGCNSFVDCYINGDIVHIGTNGLGGYNFRVVVDNEAQKVVSITYLGQ